MRATCDLSGRCLVLGAASKASRSFATLTRARVWASRAIAGLGGLAADQGRGINGCHFDVGSSGFLGREGRRKFEAQAGKQTRATIRDSGQWPATLPAWPEDEGE